MESDLLQKKVVEIGMGKYFSKQTMVYYYWLTRIHRIVCIHKRSRNHDNHAFVCTHRIGCMLCKERVKMPTNNKCMLSYDTAVTECIKA